MDCSGMSSDQVIAELVSMGFKFPDVIKAIEAVGPSVESAVDFIVNDSRRRSPIAISSSNCSKSNNKSFGKINLSVFYSFDRMRQSTLTEHLQSAGAPKRRKTESKSDSPVSEVQLLAKDVGGSSDPDNVGNSTQKATLDTSLFPSSSHDEMNIGRDWEQKVKNLLHKHFGYSSLKNFQKEALAAWLAHQDCLVLAATGSGKSLCFQIPALLTGKVVVVISPLISLMHDQCLKLAKHGVSACFLGSGQTDSSIEQKAMRGMYGIIYVCPETILRLIKPLQGLAESRGIALFAIDEVHCVSKWGHDFRPDYRRLAILRENFRADRLKFLKFDIPLMALTATATVRVREDILNSLCMSKDTKTVLTSFFRPNLRFSVKHSRTSSPSSYEKDFSVLINVYSRKQRPDRQKNSLMLQNLDRVGDSSANILQYNTFERDRTSEYDALSESDNEESSAKENWSAAENENKLTVEFLEDEFDLSLAVDDLDVSCGEFVGRSPSKNSDDCRPLEIHDSSSKEEELLELQQDHLADGPTIIYVPTRKETLSISKFLCKFGVKAAAYNAKLPQSHLRRVHKEFHESTLEVIVATIAFGMGIDKSNVRRIIHYGWPQSLEAYYQEAGRAGRDGKLADCILYANLSRTPSLLPSQRSEEQTKQAKRMLSDCFRYGMSTTSCRAKILVEYFGEAFRYAKCRMCDICVKGPPEMLNFTAEADAFMRVIAAHYGHNNFAGSSTSGAVCARNNGGYLEKLNIRALVSKIREQFENFIATDTLWWQGLARILEDKEFIREADDMVQVQVKFPEPTKLGLEFLQQTTDEPFYGYPEADMLLAMAKPKSYSSFSEWGKGWADPEIRRQRLGGKTRLGRKNPCKRKSKRNQADMKTVRGRLAAKLN